VRIISPRTLRDFWEAHADAEHPLRAWITVVRAERWTSMADVKARFPSASVVDSARVVFNIRHNDYRLIVKIWFPGQAVWVKFVGTHADYDDVDVSEL
jgi:mRNA interferase HigB